MKRIACALLLTFIAFAASAGDEMKKLAFLEGEWKGEAWYQRGPGPREHILQREKVTPRIGGNVLLVEGLGHKKLDSGAAGEVVHDALGTMGWDAEKKQYRFVAYSTSGNIDTNLDVGDNRAAWGFTTPQGRIRYTIRLTEKGEWNEVGEFSRDGEKWLQFFEMTLTKVK
ncbi:MAG TPA: hypothetical protein VKB93_29090 [Thermoanaerobaculia bacterium]|nr:hypothetical protein [Thermoanaerobaculia bacterium]